MRVTDFDENRIRGYNITVHHVAYRLLEGLFTQLESLVTILSFPYDFWLSGNGQEGSERVSGRRVVVVVVVCCSHGGMMVNALHLPIDRNSN